MQISITRCVGCTEFEYGYSSIAIVNFRHLQRFNFLFVVGLYLYSQIHDVLQCIGAWCCRWTRHPHIQMYSWLCQSSNYNECCIFTSTRLLVMLWKIRKLARRIHTGASFESKLPVTAYRVAVRMWRCYNIPLWYIVLILPLCLNLLCRYSYSLILWPPS